MARLGNLLIVKEPIGLIKKMTHLKETKNETGELISPVLPEEIKNYLIVIS
mgnify:FL=1